MHEALSRAALPLCSPDPMLRPNGTYRNNYSALMRSALFCSGVLCCAVLSCVVLCSAHCTVQLAKCTHPLQRCSIRGPQSRCSAPWTSRSLIAGHCALCRARAAYSQATVLPHCSPCTAVNVRHEPQTRELLAPTNSSPGS